MNRSLGKWKLPQPTDVKEENEWLPVPRIARTVPFGYEVDPNDEDLLLPISKELDYLEKAKAYLRQYSLRQVAARGGGASGLLPVPAADRRGLGLGRGRCRAAAAWIGRAPRALALAARQSHPAGLSLKHI